MARATWTLWLHRIGYVATAIILAELAALGWFAVRERSVRLERAEDRRIQSAMRPGSSRDALTKRYLEALPSHASLGPDAMRFVAWPALDKRVYALALRLKPGSPTARGMLVIWDTDMPGRAPERTTFSVPAQDYRVLMTSIDRRLTVFSGDDGYGTDETSLAIERVRRGSVKSGAGNFIEPYRSVGETILSFLHAAVPNQPLPPVGEDWYRPES